MHYRQLASTGIEVSVIGMGCWPIVGDAAWGPQDERDSIATLEAAFDAGVTLFDTAELYGNGYSEEMLGRVFQDRRGQIVLASKAGDMNLAHDAIKRACEGSLKRLRTDYIDVYQLHWPSRSVPFEETIGALEELKREGKIRAAALSNFGVRDLGEYLGKGGTAAGNQLAYNLLCRAIEFEILPLCRQHDIGILCYCPLMQGLLAGKFASVEDVPEGRARSRHFSGDKPRARHGEGGHEEATFAAIGRIRSISAEIGQEMAHVALAWLIHRQGVASVLAGMRTPEQTRFNAAAADLALDDSTIAALDAATEALKQAMGPNPDLWESPGRLK